ncbi:MAG TPA: hypothetical protein DEQ14_02960 [Treponema sp.]|nr:hypothetical protein [Treponema sp.]
MFDEIIVHPRVRQRHPEIKEADVIHACHSFLAMRQRIFISPDQYAAAGVDSKGRVLEIVGVKIKGGPFMVYHAAKITRKMEKELNL